MHRMTSLSAWSFVHIPSLPTHSIEINIRVKDKDAMFALDELVAGVILQCVM